MSIWKEVEIVVGIVLVIMAYGWMLTAGMIGRSTPGPKHDPEKDCPYKVNIDMKN